MKFYIKISVLLITFVFSNCWNKQGHEVTRPEIPHYTFSGIIKDVDSGELIAGSEVRLTADDLVYKEVVFNGASDTSDTSGHYEFENITPGTYHLVIKREKYEVLTVPVVVEHENKIFDIGLPKILLSHLRYQYEGRTGSRKYPRFNGICWKTPSTLAGVWHWQEYYDDPPRWRVAEGNYTSGFNIIGEKTFKKENPEMWGLTYLYNFWTCGKESKLYAIYPGKGAIESEVSMPYPIQDLTNDSTSLWATVSVGKIIKFGVQASVIEKEYDFPSENPGGIAWDGIIIWANDFAENLVYKFNDDMHVDKTFRPIYVDDSGNYFTINAIKYLSSGGDGNLWACDGMNVYVLKVK